MGSDPLQIIINLSLVILQIINKSVTKGKENNRGSITQIKILRTQHKEISLSLDNSYVRIIIVALNI